LKFIRIYLILQEESSYYFYLRKGVRFFKTTTNSSSGHEEGTNNAIKAGPSCVLPPQHHGIDKSIKIYVDTDSNKFGVCQRLMASALFGRATWSNSPTLCMEWTIWWTKSDLQIVFVWQVTVLVYGKDYMVNEF
jgi:hypothetical protein